MAVETFPSLKVKSTNVRVIVISALLRTLAAIDPALAARALGWLFLRTRRSRLPERERSWLAGAQRRELGHLGHRLVTWTWEGSGPTVLLVHGWEGRGTQLGAFVEPLRSRGFRVVALDGPGHGDSSGHRSSLVELRDAVEAVAAAERPQAIVAHSAGTVATTLAIHRGVDVERLVYLAPPLRPGTFLAQLASLLRLPAEVPYLTQQLVERRLSLRWDDLERLVGTPPLELPLLVVHDRHDREVPFADGVGLTRAWPGSRLHVTTGLGHRRLLRNPSVVGEVTSFVAGGTTQSGLAAVAG